VIEDKFRKAFLFHTIRALQSSGDWWMIPRVMKRYREEAVQLGITRSPLESLSGLRLAAFATIWALSYCYPTQADFFGNLHLEAWGQPILFPDVHRYAVDVESPVSVG
jgi:hypothetical protein